MDRITGYEPVDSGSSPDISTREGETRCFSFFGKRAGAFC